VGLFSSRKGQNQGGKRFNIRVLVTKIRTLLTTNLH
jgi:hypothetical protein